MDTICAIATASGRGGIAVIRISGPEAVFICGKIIRLRNKGKAFAELPSQRASFGYVNNKGEVLDEVMTTIFRAPYSYTGEDIVEISCHGSAYIQQQILQLLITNGCRLAIAGEFTQRAFMNGKLDLSQAEAVADLIAATTSGMHKLSLSQMRGGFSRELGKLRAQLLDFTSLIELELDFGEEDVEFADRENLRALVVEIELLIRKLTDSFNVGNAVKNGVPVAIVGETNVGKSTLLNVLLGEERAIVSDIHGTTRDAIEDTTVIEGVAFRFIDTAGVRKTDDVVENLGIERTFAKVSDAAIVLLVLDATTTYTPFLSESIITHIEGKKVIKVFNKTDLVHSDERTFADPLPELSAPLLHISAKKEENIDVLRKLLVEAAGLPEINSEDVTVTNVRHYEALTHAHEAIVRVIDGLASGLSGDFISQDIRECSYYIGEITGEITTDEILGNIFSRFCIGK